MTGPLDSGVDSVCLMRQEFRAAGRADEKVIKLIAGCAVGMRRGDGGIIVNRGSDLIAGRECLGMLGHASGVDGFAKIMHFTDTKKLTT